MILPTTPPALMVVENSEIPLGKKMCSIPSTANMMMAVLAIWSQFT